MSGDKISFEGPVTGSIINIRSTLVNARQSAGRLPGGGEASSGMPLVEANVDLSDHLLTGLLLRPKFLCSALTSCPSPRPTRAASALSIVTTSCS